MANNFSLDYTCESNAKLYAFLANNCNISATDYNISNLANQISAANNLKSGLLSLKKIGCPNDIATA